MLNSQPNTLYSQNRASLIGFTYPLKLNGRGSIGLSTDEKRVEEQIQEILQTRLTERVMRPRFGTPQLLFESVGSSEQLVSIIQNALDTYLIESVTTKVYVGITDDGGCAILVEWSSNDPTSRFATGIVKYRLS